MSKEKVNLKFNIISTGSYLPPRKVSAAELADKMAVSEQWILDKTGVKNRHFAEKETIASMGAKALRAAMDKASLLPEDLDLLIAAGGTPDQPIPHNSALIHHELKLPPTVTAFDVDATCLSFVHAMIVASSYLQSGLYKKIAIISSEKPSVGLNFESPESAALLGDGAVAFILEATDEEKGFLFSEFTTYSEYVHLTEIPSGGTRVHPKELINTNDEGFLFNMDGKNIYKKASEVFPPFYKKVLKKHEYKNEDFSLFVPHQASLLALKLMCKKLNIAEEKFVINLEKYGNLVGASIPMSIHESLVNDKIKPGDKVLLLATAAGLTLGLSGIQF